MKGYSSKSWLALVIGNSRLHWAWFTDDSLSCAWEMSHLSAETIASLLSSGNPDHYSEALAEIRTLLHAQTPLWIASVVPSENPRWQAYPSASFITLDRVPLQELYPSLGIDRALALWGAAVTTGLPALVIDAGTALTFSAANAEAKFLGGAILPGLSLQIRSLAQQTASLPTVDLPDFDALPMRWATNTPDAIRSGITYTLFAGVRDFVEAWWQQFPDGTIALTGGGGLWLHRHLLQQFPSATRIKFDPYLVFWGMRELTLPLL